MAIYLGTAVLRTKKKLPVSEYKDRNIWAEVTQLHVAD